MRPDVGLVDIGLPETSGVELVRLLKPALPGTQFLMLTVVEDVLRVLRGERPKYLANPEVWARRRSLTGGRHGL